MRNATVAELIETGKINEDVFVLFNREYRGYVFVTRGEWGTPYVGLYGDAPPKRGTFLRLEVYENVRFSNGTKMIKFKFLVVKASCCGYSPNIKYSRLRSSVNPFIPI